MEGLPVSVANYIIENEKIQLKEIYERKKLILLCEDRGIVTQSLVYTYCNPGFITKIRIADIINNYSLFCS